LHPTQAQHTEVMLWMILCLQLHDGWRELDIERDLIKPDRDVGEFLHISIQLINNMMRDNENINKLLERKKS
jgi:hypothetical protein